MRKKISLAALVILGLYTSSLYTFPIAKTRTISNTVVTVTDLDTFNSYIKTGITLVKFYLDGCPPCEASIPMMNELAQNYSDVTFLQVPFTTGKIIANKYKIRMTPTFVFFKENQKIGNNIIGYTTTTQRTITQRITSLQQ